MSLFLHSTYHYWSLKMQAIRIGSYPGQRAVYLMPVINIGPWEMCILSTLICEILQSSTESCPSLCMIIHYGGGPWPPTKINQSQYVIVPRLGGFHTLNVSFLEVVDHIMVGWSLWSLLALTYTENTGTPIFGGKVSYQDDWDAPTSRLLKVTNLMMRLLVYFKMPLLWMSV